MVTTFNICEINYINKFVKLLEIVEPANFDDIEYAEQSIIENPEATLGLDENDLVVVHTEEFEVSNYFVHTMKPLQIVLFFFSLETGSNGAKS